MNTRSRKILNSLITTFALTVTLFGSIGAQSSTFPLQSSHIRQTTTIKVVLKNTTTTNYTGRVSLSNSNNTYAEGNNHPWMLILPGAQKEFSFSNINQVEPYTARLIVTKDAQPNPTVSTFYEKTIVIKETTSPTLPTCQPPKLIINGTCILPSTNPSTNPPQNQPTNTQQTPTQSAKNECNDGIDNDGDFKADHYGVDTKDPVTGKTDGVIDLEPDPSCFSPNATTEHKDDVVSSIIPCTDKCTFSDVFRLLNNVLTFFITDLMIPIFIIIIMYAGYKYLRAGANAGEKANLKKMIGHIVGGIILILCAWLIVRTIMTTVLNDQYKQSGIEFMSQ